MKNVGAMKRLFTTYCFLLSSLLLTAQDIPVLSNGNYAGLNGADINPSFIVYSRYKTDVNFLQVRTSLFNNNFYLNPHSLPGLAFQSNPDGHINNWQHANYENNDRRLILDENISGSSNLFGNVVVKGPGFMTNDGFRAIAVQTHFKTIFDLNNVDAGVSKMLFEQTAWQPLMGKNLHMQNGSGFSMMSYGEVSFTYAKMISNRRDRIINVGVTGKLLVGFAGLYVTSRGSNFQFDEQNKLVANNLNFDLGYAMPNTATGENFLFPRGTGAAADIGFTYIKKKNPRLFKLGCPTFVRKICFTPNYKWKFGASILDFGGISYNTLTETYQYRNAQGVWDSIGDTKAKTIQEADKVLQSRFGKDMKAHDYSFFMSLPTAISLQFDYNVDDALYLNTTLIQRVVWTDGPGVRRMNALVVSPRFETDQIQVGIPVSLYEYQYPAVGLLLRYKGFFIGSDQIGSTFGLARLNGMDFYVGLKMSIHSDYSPASLTARKKRMKPVNLNGGAGRG